MVLVGLHFSYTAIIFGNTNLIMFWSITNFELLTQTFTGILVILGKIREIT